MSITTAFSIRRILLASILLISSIVLSACNDGSSSEPKTKAAKIFEPGNFSTGREYGVTFSPDSQYIYFTRGSEIYWAHRQDDGWSSPRIVEFSKGAWIADYVPDGVDVEYFNWDPVISPDGSRLFIMSHGLINGQIIDGEDGKMDIWVLEREGEGFNDSVWGTPKHVGPAINSPDHSEGAIGVSADGTAYFFSSDRSDSVGSGDIYYAQYVDGEYLSAQNIGTPINTEGWEGHTYPDPKGEFLLYISSGMPDGLGSCDIYVSHRTDAGWGTPVNLGPNVNTEACEITPSLTPDRKTLFFGRIKDREADVRNIYYVDLDNTDF